jgi:hypothetical protein
MANERRRIEAYWLSETGAIGENLTRRRGGRNKQGIDHL